MRVLGILFASLESATGQMELQPDYDVLLKISWRILCNKVNEFLSIKLKTILRTTTDGSVKGIKRRSIYNTSYYSFEGIPFAKPPIGELRFQEPEPPEPWEGIRDCTYVRQKPLQKNVLLKYIEGSEDCLYLNIYAKELSSEKPLPVIVWVHGGGFQVGENSRDLCAPDYFMEEQVILVSITYRMGAFGFLSLNDPKHKIPGNASLKDQIMAFRWVKQNIHSFNGDPNNITAMGQSAGALSIHLLMCSERARGLFHKAILMSCTALCTLSAFPQHNWAFRLAYELGFSGSNEEEAVLEFLKKTDARKIANVHGFLLNKRERLERWNAPFGPIIEPYSTEQTVLAKPVVELLKNAWGNEIPVIMGAVSFEGLPLYGNAIEYPYLVNELNDCTDYIPREVQAVCSKEEVKRMGQTLKLYYFNNAEPNIDKDILKYVELAGDYILLHGIHRGLLSRLMYAPKQPTFYYRFDYDSADFNIFRLLFVPRKFRGVIHSSDLQYMFFNCMSWKPDVGSEEYKIMKCMVAMWTAFAHNGDPNCVEVLPTKWLSANNFQLNDMKCLRIAKQISLISVPEQKKFNMWDSFYEKIKFQ